MSWKGSSLQFWLQFSLQNFSCGIREIANRTFTSNVAPSAIRPFCMPPIILPWKERATHHGGGGRTDREGGGIQGGKSSVSPARLVVGRASVGEKKPSTRDLKEIPRRDPQGPEGFTGNSGRCERKRDRNSAATEI